jgi:AraC-like DNA-binding protein
MIEKPEILRRHDRLTAFLQAFGLSAETCANDRPETSANLFVIGDESLQPSYVVFRCRSGASGLDAKTVLASAYINFGGSMNPLVGALPDELKFALNEQPHMRALAELFVAEREVSRCGGATVRDRLCEVIVVLAVRRAIAAGTVNAGLLAGLAHAELCPCLIAIHDEPARTWSVEELAQIAGMSRSQFTTKFSKVVGMPPAAYVTSWRLSLGYSRLKAGSSVKAVAAEVGFGSQEAFSRAFSRAYGYPPSAVK